MQVVTRTMQQINDSMEHAQHKHIFDLADRILPGGHVAGVERACWCCWCCGRPALLEWDVVSMLSPYASFVHTFLVASAGGRELVVLGQELYNTIVSAMTSLVFEQTCPGCRPTSVISTVLLNSN